METELLACTSPTNCMPGSEYASSLVSYSSISTNLPLPYMPTPIAESTSGFNFASILSSIGGWLGTNLNWLLVALLIVASLQLWSNYKKKDNKIGVLFSLGLFLISTWGAFCYNYWIGIPFMILSVLFIVQAENYKYGTEQEDIKEEIHIKNVPQRIPVRQPPISQNLYDDGLSIDSSSSSISLNLNLF
jgi:hypothetical protein